MTACLSFQKRRVLRHFCSFIRGNQNFVKVTYVSGLFVVLIYFLPYLFSFSHLLLLRLNFCWACLPFKNFRESITVTRDNFCHGVATFSGRNFCSEFFIQFLSIFGHILGSIEPVTLPWASLERYFPPTEAEYRWCQFWAKLMTSEVEQRTMVVTSNYGRHGCQLVKVWKEKNSGRLRLNQSSLHIFLRSSNVWYLIYSLVFLSSMGILLTSKVVRGPFLEAPVITGPVELFCFSFQMGVSKGLEIVQ